MGIRDLEASRALHLFALGLQRGFGISDESLKARVFTETVPFWSITELAEVDEAAFARGYGVLGKTGVLK